MVVNLLLRRPDSFSVFNPFFQLFLGLLLLAAEVIGNVVSWQFDRQRGQLAVLSPLARERVRLRQLFALGKPQRGHLPSVRDPEGGCPVAFLSREVREGFQGQEDPLGFSVENTSVSGTYTSVVHV